MLTHCSIEKMAARSAALYRTLVIALLALSCAACAIDKEFTVNTTQDLHDLDPGDGVCVASTGGTLCSLRAAFEETNQTINSLRVGITIPAGLYELEEGELTLNRGRVAVRGSGQGETVVDSLGGSRILNIETQGIIDVGSGRDFFFEDLGLRNGFVPPGPGDSDTGGAVRIINYPNYLVTFDKVTIENSVAGFQGGGIAAIGSGNLNVFNSRIEGNAGGQDLDPCDDSGGASGGGGIYARGSSVTVIQSNIRDNCGSNGGGIRLEGGANHLILRSTVSGNLSPSTAAGIFIEDTNGRIEDSTIAQNRVTNVGDGMAAITPEGSAGGLHFRNSNLTILSTTIVENENNFGASDKAGGLLGHNSLVSMRNTVLADNDTLGEKECVGAIDSEGGNFIGETNDDCDISAQASDILDGGDPELGNLQFNGGLTRTLRPANSSSPLVNTGVPGCEDIDQRGLSFPAPLGAACDIGAVEF